MKNKLTAKEYLQENEIYPPKGWMLKEEFDTKVEKLLEDFAALKVKEAIKPLKDIENIMGKWHRERPDDKDTIWGITKVFIGIGMLGFWEDEKQGGNQ